MAVRPAALQHLLHHGRRGEGGRLRPRHGHGPGGGRGRAQRPDAGAAPDPAHGPGRHQALHEPGAGEETAGAQLDFKILPQRCCCIHL